MTEEYQYMIEEATLCAALAHADQKDRQGHAYISHPMRVSRSHRIKHDPVLRAAAILHDVLEDTNIDLDTLETLFPGEVTDLVATLTRRKLETYHSFLWRIVKNPKATLIKLADLDDNTSEARSGGLTNSLRKRYREAYRILGEDPPAHL